jgi:hypothetical protein
MVRAVFDANARAASISDVLARAIFQHHNDGANAA